MEVGTLTPGTHVENEECCYCFNDYDGPDGVNICLQCFTCCCKKHAIQHMKERQHTTFLSRKRITIESEAEPTKLAIGTDGGFGNVKYEYEFQIRMFTEDGYEVLPEEMFEGDEEVQSLINKLKASPSISTQDLVESWELQIVECPHIKNLQQEPKENPTVQMKCDECELSNNLWLCLTCGHIGCGRRNFDGSGGNNHAVDHFDQTHHPVSVKLGTISPDGSADLYCYQCDETVTDSKISEHLKPFGIDVQTSQKTESTTTELNFAINKDWDFSAVTTDGKEFDKLEGPFSVGLRNLGNTCYMNSILQLISHIPSFVEEFLVPKTMSNLRWTDPKCQFRRLFKAMRKGKYKSVSPRILRSVICHGNTQFLSARQQDAAEFFMYLFNYIKVHYPQSSLVKSEFDAIQVMKCDECGCASTIPMKDQAFLVLTPCVGIVTNNEEEITIKMDELLETSFIHIYEERKCDKCNHVGATSIQQIKNFPEYLFVSVILDSTNEKGMVQKMNINIDMDPMNLDLTKYECTEQKETIDEQKVNELMNLGFSRAQCVRALQNVGTIEEAVDWIVSNPMEQSPAVQQVMEMGFTESEAREALEESSGNIGLAIEWLFGPRQKKAKVERSNGKGIYELIGFVQHKGPSALCGHYIANVKFDGKWILYNDEKVAVYPDDYPPQFGKGYLYMYRRKQE
ncbi:ubiquitin carboxyl-terminal hydrolase 14 [Histomonas meleagridis]|uniref:ubiquitin carboxyl-terminal hydrolase 14 n=1 Tax=Histomonas meleagridis TaxID=135588 RepID=UPI003559DEA9|nr:ubiquitin carboxyl-terminal hydrolase 14 [Histomonas meleagridis]KAH0799668.1 ubiquitin carboxyl-terminal hydrolase 14 [Histomonas meleagridis]